MEPKKLTTESPRYTRAILRACGDEPLLRFVSQREDGIVMVVSDESRTENWLGWPIGDVYAYDQEAYDNLLALNNEGKRDELVEAWSMMKRLFKESH